MAETSMGDAGLSITSLMAMPYFFAKAKSRVSCAGTAMIAPVPYSMRTKFPTKSGTRSPLKGLTILIPVSIPSFSFSSDTRSTRDWALRRSMKASTAGSVTRFRKGCSGAITMKVTPYTVSGRVVKMGKGVPSSTVKLIMSPVERPIQFFCMVRTRSGQPARMSSCADKSSSA